MRLPAWVRDGVGVALERDGRDGAIGSVRPVRGGCINNGARIETDDGGIHFLKWNATAPPGMFAAEADGLRALRDAASTVEEGSRPRVPSPMAHSEGPDAPGTAPTADAEDAAAAARRAIEGVRPSWLLMEWIPRGPPSPDGDERLGRGLALIHETASDQDFGWHRDNWIGSLPQCNRQHASWAELWREERIAPQLERARTHGYLRNRRMDELVDRIPEALQGVDQAALLHGDLWSGNTFVAQHGAPALVDPAVYLGDGEVDLAMSELFGGFGPRFYDAYAEARTVSEAYESHRRDLYQLYYLLVHVNLFGGGYAAQSERAAERVLAALEG